MSVISKSQFKDIVELYDIKTTEDAHSAVKDIMSGILQATLDAELNVSLGYDKHDYQNKKTDNSRNGNYPKKVQSTFGDIELNVPRDRKGEHEPIIVKKGKKDVSGIQDRIISMYAKGMSTRDIHDHMQEIYGIEVSAETVSNPDYSSKKRDIKKAGN